MSNIPRFSVGFFPWLQWPMRASLLKAMQTSKWRKTLGDPPKIFPFSADRLLREVIRLADVSALYSKCQSGAGSTLFSSNGQCQKFNEGYSGVRVAGGGGNGGNTNCLLHLFTSSDCSTNDEVQSPLGPINNNQLGNCVSEPWWMTGSWWDSGTVWSGYVSDCPT